MSVVSGIEEGRRLPTVPKFQLAFAGTYQWQVKTDALAYVTGTYQHIGSRFTQVGDEDLGTLDLLSFGANTIGAPLTASTFTYDPELPAYDLLNLRVGVKRDALDLKLSIDNVFDAHPLLQHDSDAAGSTLQYASTFRPRTVALSGTWEF